MAVHATVELMDPGSSTALTELNFGSMFFGEALVKQVAIFNNSPSETRFDLSYGSTTDMKALAGADKADGDDSSHAVFLQMARVTFKPPALRLDKGFAGQLLTPQQQAQFFDCLLQVSLAGGSKSLKLPIKGAGLAPKLTLNSHGTLHFGLVPTYEWADQLLQLVNSCSELPMQVAVDRSGPYFSAEPSELQLPPGASATVLLRYLPKALGRHQATLSFQVTSSKVPGRVLSKVSLQVQGSSLTLGNKQPLPGGITATPDTFKKPRAYVDESDAAVAELTAKKTFSRPQLWDTAENADSFDGIGPLDRFGLTQRVQVARAAHASHYTALLRAGRTAAARKYLTQEEGGEGDANLGMQPYRGLKPGQLQPPKQVDPLWTLKQNSVAGPTVQRLPSAAVIASITTFKEWPESAQERAECSAELNDAQLSKVVVGPRCIDFGKASPALPSSQCFVVTNHLSTAIHVVLDLCGFEGLSCSSPAAQVIPAGSTAKFQLALHCHEVQVLKERIQYCINGCHMQSLDVLAEVVAVTLELSCDELLFGFSLDNWDDFAEQGLIMENPHSFPVDYDAMDTRHGSSSSSSSSRQQQPAPSGGKQSTAQQSNQGTPGAAATSQPGVSPGTGGSSSRSIGNKTALMVQLPPNAGAESAAAAAMAGCQHTGFMTLKLKGGADAAPKKVMLHGELPVGLLKFKEKEINLGAVPLGCQQTFVAQLKNVGSADASYRVVPNAQLSVSPDRGHVAAESGAELELALLAQQPGHVAATLEVERAAPFPSTFIGAASQLPLTLVNTTPVPATLLCDLTQQPEFELTISRDDWAGAGYSACPVQRIGANGEMSTVGSMRASRRMTSQGNRTACSGGGYRFLIQLTPSSSLPLRMAYRPNKAQAQLTKAAAAAAAAAPVPEPLAVPVMAVGLVPKLILSKSNVDFGSQVVRTSSQPGKSPYSCDVYLRNNTEAQLQVSVGHVAWPKQAAACLGVYALEGLNADDGFVSLGPDEGLGFNLRMLPFSPHFVAFVPGGYDNLELSAERVRLPPDTSRLPLRLSFPEGNLIGLAKDKLPVDVCFTSGRPLSFTASLDFLDESGRTFSLPVTGSADSCSLTHQPFMQANADQLQLALGAEPGSCLQLEGSAAYQMPLDDAVGPLHLTPELRGSMRASRGKLLLELVETLGGKPVSMKCAASRKPGNRVEAAQQLLAMYEAILAHLRAHGALVNAVKPEYLLDPADFELLMQARSAAAAGNPDQEAAQELWDPVEQGFGAYSARAYNCVLLQVLKVFVLARVTPAALRQLLSSTHAAGAGSSSAPESSKPGAPATGKPLSATAAGTTSAKAAAAAQAETESGLLQAAGSAGAAAGCEVPSDDVLAASNIFSTAEACLLAWMSHHMARAFPNLAVQVTNFGDDLRNGLVLGRCWLHTGQVGSLASRLHQAPNDARHRRENQDMVVRALQELCLPYELSAAELDEADPTSMLLLVTYLFTALPQLLPRATLDFKCKLGSTRCPSTAPAVWDVQLANPTRRLLSYTARLEGPGQFCLEASVVKVEPGRTTQVPVRFSPTTSLPVACRLVLMSRRDGCSASAATLVFLLRGQVDCRAPLRHVAVAAPLYQLALSELSVTNPFPADCDFSISIVQLPPELPAASAEKKTKGSTGAAPAANTSKSAAAAAAAAASKKKAEQLQQQQMAASLFPEAFGLERHRLRLRAGASEKLKLSFLPFQMPPLQQQQQPAAPDEPRADTAAAPKALTRSLLVLSDSECGEFAYELCGEVLLPAPFLEHRATVAAQGPQTVELQLPFTNHLLEAARRTYADKHPLAKDKEQAAKLRCNIGRSSDRGARLLDYSISCSNSLVTCPQAVLLKAGGPGSGSSGGPAGGGGEGRAASANALRTPAGSLPAAAAAQAAFGSSSGGGQQQQALDAQSLGQSCVLELECPARQQVLQDVPLVNSSDGALTATATLTGRGYLGARELTVPAKGTGAYQLCFCPPGSGTFSGTLELAIAATGERNVYTLLGQGSEPLAEATSWWSASTAMRRVQVPNITGAAPLAYSVYSDLECLSGPSSFTCSSASRGDTYKLAVAPLVAGNQWGSISFVAEDGQYCWYSLEVRATEPPDLGTVNVSCAVRQAVAIQVSLTNPTDKPLSLRAHYSCPSLAGEFSWRISMEALPGGPEQLPLLAAPLGRVAHHRLTIANPTGAEAHFVCSSSDAARFCVSPSNFAVAPQGTAEVLLEYRPGSLGLQETGCVTVASNTAGSIEYTCSGKGEVPGDCESASISAALATAATSSKLSWLNPFATPARVRVQLLSREPAGTFSLQLPGAAAVQQQHPAAAVADVRGLRRSSASGCSRTAAHQDVNMLQDDEQCELEGAEPDTLAEGVDRLNRQPAESPDVQGGDALAGLLAAATGTAPSWADKGGSSGDVPRTQGAAGSRQQQRQPPQQQVSLQQVAEVTVAPNTQLQLPVSFCPQLLQESAAQISVSLVSPGVPSPEPLVWRYKVQGLAHADARGVKFTVKCKAKQSVEEVLALPLPGVDPAATARSGANAAATSQQQQVSGSVKFSSELIIPEQHKAALAAALTVEQVDQLPVVGLPGAGAVPVLRATAPEVEGVLLLEAHMGCVAELPLLLYSSGREPQPFSADFTPDSPLNFDVVPAKGMLPPAPASEAAGGATQAAPLKVTFMELGKALTGRLVVVTPDSEHTFVVQGRQPAYVPPCRSAMPSSKFLTAGTASSMSHSRSNSPAVRGSSSSPTSTGVVAAAQRAAGGSSAAAGQQQQQQQQQRTTQQSSGAGVGSKNYLQQNIKAARDGAGSRSGSGGGQGAPRQWA
ncbi:hypothetical protein COO60DRAFT_1637017 [Scenedesmus sp. NREL 46B-D3]|nr:hypothetical protein COO60DRAFT_1637017 [Scenedesmus sp. NREL 46B-D3]